MELVRSLQQKRFAVLLACPYNVGQSTSARTYVYKRLSLHSSCIPLFVCQPQFSFDLSVLPP